MLIAHDFAPRPIKMQTYILALIGNPTPANWEALKAYLNKHPLSEGLLTLSDRMAIRRALKGGTDADA